MYNGLSTKEVQDRIFKGQVNGHEKRISRTYKEIVRGNTLTYFNLVNTILFLLVFITGQFSNCLFYVTIVVNACIGIFQEIRSKKQLDKMSIMVETHLLVMRDGQWQKLPVSDIVLDDLVQLEAGMQIPADAKLLEGYLEVNESMLTGESNTVEKKADMDLYGGTIITSGEGKAKIIAVGEDCFSQKILKDAKEYNPAKSQLHEDLNKLLHIISIAIIPVGIILFVVQFTTIGLDWRNAIVKTVAAVVGMIPEGLVVLTSVALAISTIRLLQKKVLVQDLFSIEALARVDTICLDKTGTLTKGTMKVTTFECLHGTKEQYIRDVMGSYLNNDDKSNATSDALKDYFKTNRKYERTDVLPFSSDRKYAGASFGQEGSFYLGAVQFLFPKGAPAVNKKIGTYTSRGERVIVLAHSNETTVNHESIPEDLEPIAMIAIADILRDNVQEIMQYFTKQGVTQKVISGDDPATVSSLAKQAGIAGAEKYIDMAENTLPIDEIANTYTVFGRVLPDQKKELVTALQKAGHIVAMTGDGVNDVPALKQADVSVAMAAGSSAAKDSANIVLLTNDFGLMPNIVAEGRRVINNISRASSMYLVKTVFSMLLSLYVIVLQQAYPFIPIHLSLISAFGVGIPTFLLQMEPSFERAKGRFFVRAFRNAIPSAVTVLLTALICLLIQTHFELPNERYYAILVSLTAYIYLYTLFKVYYPPTTLRKIVISAMAICIVLAMFIGSDYLQIQFAWMDLFVIIPAIPLLPITIAALSRVYDAIMRFFSTLAGAFHDARNSR